LNYFKIKNSEQIIIFDVESDKIKLPFPSGISILNALENFLEIKEFPKISFLKDVV